jgi:gliding motility-associated-like protein
MGLKWVYRKFIIAFFASLILYDVNSYAAPTWSVDPAQYTYSMTVMGPLIIEGTGSTDHNDMVGAFVGGICRGVTHLQFIPGLDKDVVFLMIYSNVTSGETVELRIYGASTDQVFVSPNTISFIQNGQLGTSSSPYPITTNNAPTNLQLSNNTVDENLAAGTTIGTLTSTDTDPGNILTYSLQAGVNDNDHFTITGNQLQANEIFDFETKDKYTITIQVSDNHNGNLKNDFFVFISNKNDPPVITPTYTFTVNDDLPESGYVGTISATDQDVGQTCSYAVLTADFPGYLTVNSAGIIKVAAGKTLSYEDHPAYHLSIIVTDNGVPVKTDTTQVTVNITDTDYPPSDISLSNNHLNENQPIGTEIATLTATDPEPDVFTFTLPAGQLDNHYFTIAGNKLKSDTVFNYEKKNIFSIFINVADAHNNFQKQCFIYIDDVNENPTIANQECSISEGVAIGTYVATVNAFDVDKNQTLTFAITGGNTNAAFKIDKNTGDITVNNPNEIDYEVHPQFVLTIRATDNASVPLSTEATMTIDIVDINYAPTSIDLTNNQIPENSAIGTLVGTLSASDPETTETFTFGMPNVTDTNDFRISGNSLITKTIFNYEAKSNYPITIKVTDGGGKTLSKVFQIGITDVNEKPVINDQSFDVLEGTSNGSLVGNLQASDGDKNQTLTYDIISGNTSNAFSVAINTGQLTVNNAVVLVSETHPEFHLTVIVSDNQSPAMFDTATITIYVLNVPSAITNLTISDNHIDENAVAGTVIGKLTAAGSEPTDKFTITLLPELDFNKFSINSDTNLVSTAVFDYEVKTSYNVKVKAVNTFNVALVKTFQLLVNDKNEKPCMADQSFSILEDQPTGTSLGYITASDVDYGQSLSFEILSGNIGNAFTLNKNSGELTINNQSYINYEDYPTFTLTVRTYDNAPDHQSDTAQITVNLTDYNYKPASLDLSNNTINENSPIGTVIGYLSATDPEPAETFSFVLRPADSIYFRIQNGNELGSKVLFNYEEKSDYTVVIKVVDSGNAELSKSYKISVKDINEAPVIDDQTFSVVEAKSQNSTIGYVLASDVDFGQSLLFDIISGNTDYAFAIGVNSGVLTVNNPDAVDYEINPVFNLKVRVHDNGSPSKSDTATITVNVLDYNYKPTNLTISYDKIEENLPAGTLIGLLYGQDPEPTDTFTFALRNLRADDSYFQIAGNRLVSNVPFDFEEKNEYVLSAVVYDKARAGFNKDLLISIIDKNDTPQIIDASFDVNEDSPANTSIGYVEATDADKGQVLTYSIVAGNDGSTFKIDKSSGLLQVNKGTLLDYETTRTFQLKVVATDNGTPHLTDTAQILINVLDVNYPPYAMTISDSVLNENQTSTVFIGKVKAFDAEPHETFTYSIDPNVKDNNMFLVRNDSIFATTPADYENKPVLFVQVRATDTQGETLDKTFSIRIIDGNEPPNVEKQIFTIPENPQNGSSVGKIVATDPDNNATLSYHFISGNDDHVFDLDSLTGEIKIHDNYSINYEKETGFSLVVEVKDNGKPPLSDTATIKINVTNLEENQLIITNLFTPNNDGYNDTWVVDFPGQVSDFELFIFDIAGSLVYHTTSYQNDWNGTSNGKPLPEGTYYYLFKSSDGTKIYKGFIDIKR